jgi:hypothetical protein
MIQDDKIGVFLNGDELMMGFDGDLENNTMNNVDLDNFEL